jgi:hypothetical protein
VVSDSEISLQRLLRSCEDCDLANSLSKSDSLAQLDLAVEEDIALLVRLRLVDIQTTVGTKKLSPFLSTP